MIFEYMEFDLHGLLESKINYEPAHIKCIMQQLLRAIEFLHRNSIMHRDIKCANILMNRQGQIKLADFGLATNYNLQRRGMYTTKVVTLWYRAPELLLGAANYTPAIDMWSVGCCLGDLLVSQPLFHGSNEREQLQYIYQLCGSPTEETWPGVSSLRYFVELTPKTTYPSTILDRFKDNPR
jgi:cyclin-dependent kinase 12/13